MDLKEKFKTTLTSINEKLSKQLIMFQKKLGVNLSTYISADEKYVINTPGDVIQIGDEVKIEENGLIVEDGNFEGRIVGAEGEYWVKIEEGVVKDLKKIEDESEEDSEDAKEYEKESAELSKLESAFGAYLNKNEKIFNAFLNKFEKLEKEIEELKNQNKTIWSNFQKKSEVNFKKSDSKMDRLRDLYNNI